MTILVLFQTIDGFKRTMPPAVIADGIAAYQSVGEF